MKSIAILIAFISSVTFASWANSMGPGPSDSSILNRQPPLPPQRPPRRPPPPPPPMPRSFEDEQYVGRLFNNESLDLDYLFRLNWRYRGCELDRVRVEVKNTDPRSQTIELHINHMVEDRVIPYSWYVDLAPRGFREIGRDIRWAQLFLGGWVNVGMITLRLTCP